ncbi:crotonase/enoyl-CoA hydratase family protein [Wenxinia saemankumensis]|uniref:Vanillin synthase /trans-feruloyl-CoA hydratase n=1 Tax=Wenxinia saemankumensis TaxID=1447782 RepID=A0A1M6HNN6_9RHOB|nr:crotonase/enoyl-CoA hydratase family protein [Wenxinia saemankumensis]SHJ23825.1 vanillin synthase /trans-feruloyl-CoA hydratase [Wenxinia saemankumensis]
MSQRDLVTYERDGDVAIIGLNRPEKRNAISDRLIEGIGAAVERARGEARAGVILGHGAHFCAGLDLAEHAGRTPMEAVANSRRWHEIFTRIEFGPIPWFAALHGAVIGGGLELAAAAHVRVAEAGAFFALPEGTRGIFVGGGGAVRIARLMGTARMTDMMLTGRSLDAATAGAWNLCQYVVPEGEARTRALELARHAAGNADLSTYAILNALPRIDRMARDDGLFVESLVSAFTSTSPEAEARLQDFLQKRSGKVARPEG